MITKTMTKTKAERFKEAITVPFRELKMSDKISFIIFQIGVDSYYIKVTDY